MHRVSLDMNQLVVEKELNGFESLSKSVSGASVNMMDINVHVEFAEDSITVKNLRCCVALLSACFILLIMFIYPIGFVYPSLRLNPKRFHDVFPVPVDFSPFRIFSLPSQLLRKRVNIPDYFSFDSSILSIFVSSWNIYNGYGIHYFFSQMICLFSLDSQRYAPPCHGTECDTQRMGMCEVVRG